MPNILTQRTGVALYVAEVLAEPAPGCRVRAWAPRIEGISEVFHARIVDYGYPPHCHDTWTLLIVDGGAISYDLDTRRRAATGRGVTLLPPGVVHDGRPADGAVGFTKRVLYLRADVLPATLMGAAVDRTNLQDPGLRAAIARLHESLTAVEDVLDAESRLALIAEQITGHLEPGDRRRPLLERRVAHSLRSLLDEHLTTELRLADAAAVLGRSTTHLIRSFTAEFGVSPHAYVVGRRIDKARQLLLAGVAPAEVATRSGFCDQSHLTRHFKRYTSTTPGAFASSSGQGGARHGPRQPSSRRDQALAGDPVR